MIETQQWDAYRIPQLVQDFATIHSMISSTTVLFLKSLLTTINHYNKPPLTTIFTTINHNINHNINHYIHHH
jgi:hypothetical protein